MFLLSSSHFLAPPSFRNVLTASFYEPSIIRLLVDVALLGLLSKYVDELLEPLQMAIYLVVSAIGSAVTASVLIITAYVITRFEGLLFNVSELMPSVVVYLVVLS